MELRSYNVERIYKDTVKCIIGEDLGVNKEYLYLNSENIKDMISQIYTPNGTAPLCLCNVRKDGEIWTPYLQIVEMLIRMGRKLGFIEYEGKLKPETLIKINYGEDKENNIG